MPKTLIRENPAVDPSLLALKPRQVLLANLTTMKKPSCGKASSALTADQKARLLQAVAQFLDRSGFSKTLKKFRSEAQVEKDGQKGSTLDLEEIYHKYLEMWNLSNTEVSNQDKQDTKNEDTSKRDEERDSTEIVETGSKKNNKISKLSNSNNAKEIITNDAAPELNIRSKKTKKSKKISDSLGQGTEQFNTEISKGPAGLIACVSHMEEEPDKKSKEKKKKKSKSDSGSLVNSVEHPLLESLPGATEEKSVECSRDAQANNSSATAEDKSVKSKGKKKKEDNLEDLETGDVNGNHSKDNDCETPDDDVANNKKKSSKKRKRLASEENDLQPIDKKAAEESKRRKVEGLQQSERSQQPAEVNASLVSDGQTNGSLEENGEKPAFQKTKNQHNGSVEPKTANAFRRIKAEEVIFTDKRLEDNSYWAKDGAESGYGAKAQEILGQVRGRDFRHEKTKKKRGTYRGGQIDLQSHSVKFNYSDEE